LICDYWDMVTVPSMGGASSPVGKTIPTSNTASSSTAATSQSTTSTDNTSLSIGRTAAAPNFGQRIAGTGSSSGIQPFTGAPPGATDPTNKAGAAALSSALNGLNGAFDAMGGAIDKAMAAMKGKSGGNAAAAGAGKSGGCGPGGCPNKAAPSVASTDQKGQAAGQQLMTQQTTNATDIRPDPQANIKAASARLESKDPSLAKTDSTSSPGASSDREWSVAGSKTSTDGVGTSASDPAIRSTTPDLTGSVAAAERGTVQDPTNPVTDPATETGLGSSDLNTQVAFAEPPPEEVVDQLDSMSGA
jgi:hypothetical protein